MLQMDGVQVDEVRFSVRYRLMSEPTLERRRAHFGVARGNRDDTARANDSRDL